MYQLLGFVLVSPVGMFVAPVQLASFAAMLISDCDECGFNDLGKLLFGGLLLALIVGVAVSLLHRRMKDKRAADSEFVSIRSSSREK